MSAEASGRMLLRADAAYCAAAGAVAVGARAPLARLLGTSTAVPTGVGAATLGWAAVVAGLASAPQWRRSLALVSAANTLGAGLIAGLAVAVPRRRAARAVLGGVALDVAGFAGAQAIALRR
jgi:hypothetical protein